MGLVTVPQNPFPPSSSQVGSGDEYTLPIASAETLGGVKVGSGLSINSETGVLSASGLPIASAETLGGVKVGSGLSINSETGELSANVYTLPTASAETLGGVKVGSGLSINDGVLSASDGSVTNYSTTEREIGKYFGKTLYEKSYILFENGVAQYQVQNNEYQIGMTGYDDVFIAEVVGVRSDAGDTYVDTMCSGAELIVVFNKTDGNIYFTSGHGYTSFIAVVRYTKQTV